MTMTRLAYDGDAIGQFFAEQQRALILGAIGDESALDPLDKTDRADILPGTALKLWDDVRLYNYIDARVICAAQGRTQFFTYRFDASNGGHVVESWQVDAVSDRAPADPAETPMPIVPPAP